MKIVLALVAVAIVVGGGYGIYSMQRTKKYRQAVKDTVINEVDLSQVADGSYTGSHDVDMINATVQVDVKDHKITNIELVEHMNDQGEAAEKIVPEMVSQQKIKVDAVSGATNSSKVIQKAVQNALEEN
ncbi:FMN-binding protein [Enterococcus sp. 669A]|uniref:FMN-binding protein n=1 Tax=Candidatus Enterococcus moelleringii TaxID=2815325 RepID=A0ABS3LB71_9ENTE|nr:FMN-binding protein [Enterococcus sp. 669A]MBO1306866.1 FMN-binding protein [Enterococcus sp. 669A]